jgi:hypothetical protein
VSYEDAVWQYFLDHARAVKDGGFVFLMPELKDKEDLLRRIKVRQEGKYRYTEEQLRNQKPVIKKRDPWRKKTRKFLHWLMGKI